MSLAMTDEKRAPSRMTTRDGRDAHRSERAATTSAVEIDDITLLPLDMEGDGLAHGGRSRRKVVPIPTYEPVGRVPQAASIRPTIRRVGRSRLAGG